jgi:beta-lactamase regulating signal transducer with metallopeptidase domain
MIDSFFELVAERALLPVYLAAWRSLPLFCVALIFQLLTRRRIAARYHCFLWMMVVVRLMVPYSVPLGLSIQPHIDRLAEQWLFDESNEEVAISDPLEFVQVTPEEYNVWVASRSEVYDFDPAQSAVVESGFDWNMVSMYSFLSIWLIVATLLICRSLTTYLRFSFRLRRCSEITDQSVIDLVLRVCDELKIGRRPKLKEVPGLAVPAVFGLFKPVICIPSDGIQQLTADQLKWVLLHELGHVRRRDPLVLAIAVFVRAVHWFNPLVWLTVSRLRGCMELAADEIVVRHVPERSVADYGRMLVQYASLGLKTRDAVTVGLIFMSADKSLKKRILMLADHQHRSRWLQCVAALIVLAAAVTGLTEAKVVAVSHRPEIYLPVLTASQVNITPKTEDDGPLETVTFDVSNALAAIQRLHPEADNEDEILAHFQLFVPTRSEIKDGKVTVEVNAKTQQAIRSLLNGVERGGLHQVVIECRWMTVSDVLINNLDWFDDSIISKLRNSDSHRNQFQAEPMLRADTPFEPNIHVQQSTLQSCPVFDLTLNDRQAYELISSAQGDTRSNIMFAPKVTFFTGQIGSIEDFIQRPYVTNIRLTGEAGSDMEPVVEMVGEGTQIELKADVTEELDTELQALVTLSRLQKVELANLPFASPDNPKANITVQVPSVNRTLIRSSARLSRGQSLLIAAPQVFSADADNNDPPVATLILLSPSIIPYETIVDK